MIFVGDWEDALASVQPIDPATFFDSLYELDPGWRPDETDWGPGEEVVLGSCCLYVYRCQVCGRHRATADSD